MQKDFDHGRGIHSLMACHAAPSHRHRGRHVSTSSAADMSQPGSHNGLHDDSALYGTSRAVTSAEAASESEALGKEHAGSSNDDAEGAAPHKTEAHWSSYTLPQVMDFR